MEVVKGMSQKLKNRWPRRSIEFARYSVASGYRVAQLALFFIVLVSVFFLVTPLHAQSASITAEVDRERISLNEYVILSIVITGDTDMLPGVPTVDFDIIGTSRASQTTMINGNVTTQSTYSFTLQPKRTGLLQIDSIEVEIDGQSYKSAPITVRVGRGSTTVQPTPVPDYTDETAPSTLEGQDFFIEAEVDNLTPYIGQQVVYTFRFYQAVNLRGQPHYEAPDFAGFWNQHETPQNTYQTQAANRTYLVTELTTLLFPTVVGERTINPALLSLPGTFFQRGETLGTDSITLDVQPLPQPEPDGFSGAVGAFDISASMDPTEVEIDEPITLQVVVEGFGNAEAIPQPELPELDGWRVFEATSDTSTEMRDGALFARREDEQLWIPNQGGTYTLPTISYIYFNPDTERYETINSEPITLNVLGEDPLPVPTTPPEPSQNNQTSTSYPEPEIMASFEADIRPIKAVPATLTPARPALVSRLNYRIAWLMPLLLFAVHFIWRWRRNQLLANPSSRRRSKAHKKARAILKQAQKEESNLYVAIHQAITTYLSDKIGQPIKGLTHTMLVTLLQEKGVNPALTSYVIQILTESEQGRFAPRGLKGGPVEALMKRTEKLLSDLEQSL